MRHYPTLVQASQATRRPAGRADGRGYRFRHEVLAVVFRVTVRLAGPGLGGHCIPIDPFYLTWKAREYGLSTRFIELAGEINTGMPHHVVRRAAAALNDDGKCLRGARVLVLGVAYKRDVDDCRESPGLELLALLTRKGAEVRYHDPHVPHLVDARHGFDLESQALTATFLRQQDCVLIVTDHSAYDWDSVVAHSPLLVDTRNATPGVTRHRAPIVRA